MYDFLHGRLTETALPAQKEITLKDFELRQVCIGICIAFLKCFWLP